MPTATLALPTAAKPRRRGGWTPVAEDPRHWPRHIECATLYLVWGWPAKRVACSMEVDRSTVYAWVKLALTYDTPEAEGLRRMAARTRVGRVWLSRLGKSRGFVSA